METHNNNKDKRLEGEEVYVGQLVKSNHFGYGTVLDKRYEEHQTPITLDYYCVCLVLVLESSGACHWYDVDVTWLYTA